MTIFYDDGSLVGMTFFITVPLNDAGLTVNNSLDVNLDVQGIKFISGSISVGLATANHDIIPKLFRGGGFTALAYGAIINSFRASFFQPGIVVQTVATHVTIWGRR